MKRRRGGSRPKPTQMPPQTAPSGAAWGRALWGCTAHAAPAGAARALLRDEARPLRDICAGHTRASPREPGWMVEPALLRVECRRSWPPPPTASRSRLNARRAQPQMARRAPGPARARIFRSAHLAAALHPSAAAPLRRSGSPQAARPAAAAGDRLTDRPSRRSNEGNDRVQWSFRG